jgi:RNA ligase
MLKLETFLNNEYVFHNTWEDLIIFTYTRECQYARAWDNVTRLARGLIFNRVTGELLARPYQKFFNLLETFETQILNLPEGPFTVTEKLDGSLGIQYFYKGEYWIATKGSFVSDQSNWATEWLRKNVRLEKIRSELTYLYEIIYKKNKIVVDYGDYEGLTLLGCIDTATGHEVSYEELIEIGLDIDAPVVRREIGFSSMEDLYTYCKTLPSTKEGFVVTFSNGLKVKIKGDEYCKIHKLLTRMTPIAFWEAWDFELKDIPVDYLAGLPEEFRGLCDALHKSICEMHRGSFQRYQSIHEELIRAYPGLSQKEFVEKVRQEYPNDFNLVMLLHNGKVRKVWDAIHRRVRPTYNVLPKNIEGADRLQRILQEN